MMGAKVGLNHITDYISLAQSDVSYCFSFAFLRVVGETSSAQYCSLGFDLSGFWQSRMVVLREKGFVICQCHAHKSCYDLSGFLRKLDRRRTSRALNVDPRSGVPTKTAPPLDRQPIKILNTLLHSIPNNRSSRICNDIGRKHAARCQALTLVQRSSPKTTPS